MNENFKQLAVQAKIQMCSDARLQEFGELIVKECMSIIINRGAYLRYDTLAKEVGDKFGVKE
jgi:hypothetical protein